MERKKLLIITLIVCLVLVIFGVVFQLLTARRMTETNISLDPAVEETFNSEKGDTDD